MWPDILQLVTHGETRDEALATMAKALDHYCIQGSVTAVLHIMHYYTHTYCLLSSFAGPASQSRRSSCQLKFARTSNNIRRAPTFHRFTVNCLCEDALLCVAVFVCTYTVQVWITISQCWETSSHSLASCPVTSPLISYLKSTPMGSKVSW